MKLPFGRNKSLPESPPEVPQHVEFDDALRSIREKEKRRLSEAELLEHNIPFIRIVLIYSAIWIAVASSIVLASLALRRLL